MYEQLMRSWVTSMHHSSSGSDVAERTLQEARVEDFLEVGDTARMPRLAVAAQVTRVQVRYVGLQFVIH